MSDYTLTREDTACVHILDAIKGVWGRHGGLQGAIKIGLDGPEISNAILKVLYELTDQNKEEIARFVETRTIQDAREIAQAIRQLEVGVDGTEIDTNTTHNPNREA